MNTATIQLRAYCSNCDKDGGYANCLVVILADGSMKLQYPEEILPKGWRMLSPKKRGIYGEAVCADCFITRKAMGTVSS